MLGILSSVFLTVCILFLLQRRWKSNGHTLPPLYPGALPFVGHLHVLLSEPADLWLRLQDVARYGYTRGGVVHARLGPQVYYLITDPQDALTASNACTTKHFAFDFAKSWIGSGLVNASGEIWKRHRKLLNPAFSIPVVHGFLDIFNSQARKFIKQMEVHATRGVHFEHQTYLRDIMLETLCLATFGINAIEDKKFIRKYMNSVDTIFQLLTKRFLTFWLHNDILYKLSGLKKIENGLVRVVNEMTDQVLQRKKLAMKSEAMNNKQSDTIGIKFKPFMDLILELSADGTLTHKEIREEMDTIIGAGFETTSSQLMFTLLLLGAHPDVQHKMLTELLDVVGPDGDVYKDDLNKLVYTNAVIMESLRLLPLVPILLRHVDTDVKLKNYTMRAGSECIIYPLLHQQEPMWGPEGDKFIPERWLADGTRVASKEFAGFGLGKRTCVGKQYALVSMKVMLAHFIRHYKVTADISKLKLKCDLLLKPVVAQTIAIQTRK